MLLCFVEEKKMADMANSLCCFRIVYTVYEKHKQYTAYSVFYISLQLLDLDSIQA